MIRVFDLILSFFLLIICFPIIFVIACANLLYNKQIFYYSERIGFNGKKLKVIKFLTMRNEKILKLGLFLRRSSLDELPQLINVLKGEMSLVGPRPYPVQNFNNLKESVVNLRHSIRPGITGLAQIKYSGKKRSTQDKINLDLKMIKKFNLITYLKILILTPKVLFIRFFNNRSGKSL